MTRYVWTLAELHASGTDASELAQMCRRRELRELLPRIYSSRTPTTMDKCHAVALRRPDAVLSHGTAAWLHGLRGEPSVAETYVRELAAGPTPAVAALARTRIRQL